MNINIKYFYEKLELWFKENKNKLNNQDSDFLEELIFNKKNEITDDLLNVVLKLTNTDKSIWYMEV